LQRFDRVLGGKSPHNQGQLTIARHLDGFQINTLHVFCGASIASIHFMVSHFSYTRGWGGLHHCSTAQALIHWKELKEVSTTHGHRNSLMYDPEFPSFHEADIQSLF
jgi:hypothetical protein